MGRVYEIVCGFQRLLAHGPLQDFAMFFMKRQRFSRPAVTTKATHLTAFERLN